MSDYIDELVRRHGWDGNVCLPIESAVDLARAVAERVMERARVCSWCHGSGLHPGPYDDVPTCDRCAGRGVTFGGEA